jgi:hypothetical protein
MEKFVKVEILKTAFQIELDSSQFVILFSKDDDNIYRLVSWYDHESGTLKDPFNGNYSQVYGTITGWAKIPYEETC